MNHAIAAECWLRSLFDDTEDIDDEKDCESTEDIDNADDNDDAEGSDNVEDIFRVTDLALTVLLCVGGLIFQRVETIGL